jgi:hypothetical protein
VANAGLLQPYNLPMETDASLDARGHAALGPLLTAKEIAVLTAMYADDRRFRSRIVMQRHGFGAGEYKYFTSPLPAKILQLRVTLYERLVGTANRWQEQMGLATRFPETHKEMLARCHADGQTRPTPLLLSYGKGDFNRLHQDLYGPHVFPLQVVILLSDPSAFSGGEFVLTEQRPRMQSRVEVVPLRPGHGVAFAVNEMPRTGARGYYRVKIRHGVSEIRRGRRLALGIIFHDAT